MKPAFLGLCFLLGACAPKPIWFEKSPDRTHEVKVLQSHDGQQVLLDGKELGRYDGVAVSTFTFSPDGRQWAYAARLGNRWILYHNQNALGEWDGIGEIRFSPEGNHLAFSAERSGKWHINADGKDGPPFDALLQGSLKFSVDGKHFAYAGSRNGKTVAMLDQKAGPEFDGVGRLTFSARDGHMAYVARREKSGYVVYDGEISVPYDVITELKINASGNMVAYLIQRNSQWHAIVDKLESPAYDAVRNLVFSPDGHSVAWIAEMGRRDHLILNGVQGAAFNEIAGPNFSGDGRHWGYSARDGKSWRVILDGKEIARESWAGPPVFGSEGRVAYLAQRQEQLAIIIGELVFPFDLVLAGTLTFDSTGTRWGCIAGDRRKRKFFFVIDGKRRDEVDLSEVAGVAMKGSLENGEDVLRSWVSAVLRQAPQPAGVSKPRLLKSGATSQN